MLIVGLLLAILGVVAVVATLSALFLLFRLAIGTLLLVDSGVTALAERDAPELTPWEAAGEAVKAQRQAAMRRPAR